MTATVLALQPRHDDEQTLPVFRGGTYDEHVAAWRTAYAEARRQQWQLAAIAASLARSVGGSPRHQAARQLTMIQRFCRDVRIDRQTFQRYSRTYKTFAETGTTSGTRFHLHELSFKHFEVAARLSTDPAAAVAEADEKGWSANELERQLARRPDPPPPSRAERVAKLIQMNLAQIASWPEDEQAAASGLLEEVFHGVIENLTAPKLLPLTPEELKALRWIKADLEYFPFVKHTFNEIPVGRGGSYEVVGGAAGAPIYQAIIGTTFSASRQGVLKAVNKLIEGAQTPLRKETRLHSRVREVARDLVDGRLWGRMLLPPEAGDEASGTLFECLTPDDDLPRCLSELVTPDDEDDPIAVREEEAMAL